LASIVLSTFDDNGRGVNLQGAEIESLQTFIGLPRGVTDRLEFDEFPDVSSFVTEVVRLIKLNTILVGFAAFWWEKQNMSGRTIQLTANEREELRLAVFWCFLLHAVCKKVMFQPRGVENCLMEQLVSVFTKKRTEVRKKFKKCSGSFGTMKVWGVDKAMKSDLNLKLGRAAVNSKGVTDYDIYCKRQVHA